MNISFMPLHLWLNKNQDDKQNWEIGSEGKQKLFFFFEIASRQSSNIFYAMNSAYALRKGRQIEADGLSVLEWQKQDCIKVV